CCRFRLAVANKNPVARQPVDTGGYSRWQNVLRQNDGRAAVVDSLLWIARNNARSPVAAGAPPTSRVRPTSGAAMRLVSLVARVVLRAIAPKWRVSVVASSSARML